MDDATYWALKRSHKPKMNLRLSNAPCAWLYLIVLCSNGIECTFILHILHPRAPDDMSAKVGSLQVLKVSRYRRIDGLAGNSTAPNGQNRREKKRPKAILSTQWLNSYQTISHMKTHRVILSHFTHVNQGSHWDSLGIFRSHLERPSCWKSRHFQLKCCRVATVFQHTAETNQTSNERV